MPFQGFIHGLPKNGKGYLGVFFADYLQEYHGRVLYVAAEERESVSLQNKFKACNGSKVTVLPTCDRELIRLHIKSGSYDFVFIDSINKAHIDDEFLEQLKSENPTVSFVAICQATKTGNFKGDQSLTHNCDFIIEVINCVAYCEGRFNSSSTVEIFKEPLYQKNPKPKVNNQEDVITPSTSEDQGKEVETQVNSDLPIKEVNIVKAKQSSILERKDLFGAFNISKPKSINIVKADPEVKSIPIVKTDSPGQKDWLRRSRKISYPKKDNGVTAEKVVLYTGLWLVGKFIANSISKGK